MFSTWVQQPGEHPFQFSTSAGTMEGVLTVPEEIKTRRVAFLGHPHSLQGGSMNNKVVTTVARALRDLGIPALRFNFRGVGQSAGQYDAGIGESEDMLALVALWQEEFPEAQPCFIGFSFGSYVAYRAAAQTPGSLLVTIAPPVMRYDYQAFTPAPSPWIVLIAEADEVVDPQAIADFALNHQPPLRVYPFPDTSHFFHGKLLQLRTALTALLGAEAAI